MTNEIKQTEITPAAREAIDLLGNYVHELRLKVSHAATKEERQELQRVLDKAEAEYTILVGFASTPYIVQYVPA